MDGPTLPAMARATLSVFAAFSLLMAPVVVHAQGAVDSPVAATVKPPPMGSVDSLGRPFPNPDILKNARLQAGFGAGLTAGAGVLLFTGMMVGSAGARGELTLPRMPGPRLIESDRIADSSIDGFIFIGVFGGLGIVMAFVGIPLLSVGMFTTKQMLRTIKGAEKVPRTVANESVYWRGLQTQHFGQAIGIAGGALVAVGVVAVVGQGATVGTQVYDPVGWAIGPSILVGGVAVLILGIKTTQTGRATQKTLWDEVDPRRQPLSAVPGLPLPIVATRPGPRGPETWGGVAWSLSF